MIVRRPQKPDDAWKWTLILLPRRFGDFVVWCEWLKFRYTDKGQRDYSIEWRTRDDQELHTEFGQHEPEW